MKKIFKFWVLPILTSLALFVAIRPAFAELLQQELTLSDYLKSNNVSVGSEVVDGYNQVYYEYNGNKKFVTEGNINHHQPDSRGEYIAYVGNINEIGQIFLYNITTGSNLQLTNSSTNLRPKVSKEGKVVWEGWLDDRWQIYLFDGTKIYQLTQGDVATNPDIEGDFISYARRDISGTWRGELYSISRGKSADISTGIGSKRPKLSEGNILMLSEKGGVEKFALKAEDLFTLELAPLTTPTNEPETVTTEEILQELGATPSAILEQVSPTPTALPSPSPEATH